MGTRAPRILCLRFPDWTLQRHLVARPELDRCLFLLTESGPRGEFVRHCNRPALKRGVRVGMPVSEARTFSRPRDRLVVEEIQPAQDRQALVKLALRCERFSFCIGPEEADRPECILMDVTGIAPFFAGEQGLAAELDRVFASRGYDGRIAIGETVGAAWAAARFLAGSRRPVVIAAGELRLLEPLPVAGLRLKDAVLTKLHRLGLRTVGQVLALDRAALTRRFGTDVVVRLDQLLGRRPESIVPCRRQPKYRIERHLEEGLSHPEAIERCWSPLLRQLLELLAPRRLGTRHLKCRFALEDRTSQSLSLRLREATDDERHLAELLRFRQERLRLPSAVVGLRMEALDVSPLEAAPQAFFDAGRRDRARQYAMLLNRLSSRLGEQAVLIPGLLPDPIPERAVRLDCVADATAAGSSPFSKRLHGLDRPTALFSRPRPIEVVAAAPDGPPVVLFRDGTRYDVAQTSEPERIESGWWEGEYVRRDYYRVETHRGHRLWIFRRLQDGRWFWHGEFL